MTDTAQNPQAEPPPPNNGVTLQRPLIVALLYLLNIFLGFSVFVGLVLAYIWRNEPDTQEWERTHYTYLIRTFWIGLVLLVAIFAVWMMMIFGIAISAGPKGHGAPPAGFFLGMFGGMALFLLSAVWFFIRSILSMVKSGNQQPMPRPETLLL